MVSLIVILLFVHSAVSQYQDSSVNQQHSVDNEVFYASAPLHYVDIGQQLAGDYKFGYDTGKGPMGQSFREETRLADGTIRGSYGVIDSNGHKRIVRYSAGKGDFVTDRSSIASSTTLSALQQQSKLLMPQSFSPLPIFKPSSYLQSRTVQPVNTEPIFSKPTKKQLVASKIRSQNRPSTIKNRGSSIKNQNIAPQMKNQNLPFQTKYQNESPMMYQKVTSPVKYQNVAPPVKYQTAVSSVEYQNTASPIEYQQTASPVEYQNTASPVQYQSTALSSEYQNAGLPVDNEKVASPVEISKNKAASAKKVVPSFYRLSTPTQVNTLAPKYRLAVPNQTVQNSAASAQQDQQRAQKEKLDNITALAEMYNSIKRVTKRPGPSYNQHNAQKIAKQSEEQSYDSKTEEDYYDSGPAFIDIERLSYNIGTDKSSSI